MANTTNITTLADVQAAIQEQDHHPVQYITLNPGPVFNEQLRQMAINRLNDEDYRLPIINNSNGFSVGDAQEIATINGTLGQESIRRILMSISANNLNREGFEEVLSYVSPRTLELARNILGQPQNSLEAFTPILNLMVYANIGLDDFNIASQSLSTLLVNMNPPDDSYENGIDEAVDEMKKDVNESNEESKKRQLDYNRRRSQVIRSLMWRNILRGGSTMLVLGAATWMGAPSYLATFGSLGLRMIENSASILPTPSMETEVTPRTSGSAITWSLVTKSFWASWSLLATYMGNKND